MALHITTHMEVAYPPHPMLLPSSRKQMARQCLAYVEKDMAAGAQWAEVTGRGAEAADVRLAAGARGERGAQLEGFRSRVLASDAAAPPQKQHLYVTEWQSAGAPDGSPASVLLLGRVTRTNPGGRG